MVNVTLSEPFKACYLKPSKILNLLIIDDGSTDSSLDIINHYKGNTRE